MRNSGFASSSAGITASVAFFLLNSVTAQVTTPPYHPTTSPPHHVTTPPLTIHEIEKEMSDRPLEAFAIARRAADQLSGQPELLKKLFATAARLQEGQLRLLNEGQAVELASVYAKTLADAAAADRVQRSWLNLREQSLGPAEGFGRFQLARLHLRWLRDQQAAARLCREALRVAPELAEAEEMLQTELGYRRTETGWLPDEKRGPADRSLKAQQIRPGIAGAEVRRLLGRPNRSARQILYRRYLDQWLYDDLPGLCIEFDCLKGEEAHVSSVRNAAAMKQ